MNNFELAYILRGMCRDAPEGEKSTTIHLFGIRYATELAAHDVNVNEVVRLAGSGDTSQRYTRV